MKEDLDILTPLVTVNLNDFFILFLLVLNLIFVISFNFGPLGCYLCSVDTPLASALLFRNFARLEGVT